MKTILQEMPSNYPLSGFDLNNYIKMLDKKVINNNLIHFPLQDDGIGIEVEVENHKNVNYGYYSDNFWTYKEDNSLRNSGIEYVTNLGLSLKHSLEALENLFKYIPEYIESNSRCSTHIHMNILDLTQEQLLSLVMIYALSEHSLYEFAGMKRYKNIFCVPLLQSDLFPVFKNYSNNFIYISKHWPKYCGINLNTICKYGTVEFRQLRGTYDVSKIITWIKLLWKMKEYVISVPYKEVENQFIDNPEKLIDDVFNPYERFFTASKAQIKESSAFIKSALIVGELEQDIQKNINKPKEIIGSIAGKKGKKSSMYTNTSFANYFAPPSEEDQLITSLDEGQEFNNPGM